MSKKNFYILSLLLVSVIFVSGVLLYANHASAAQSGSSDTTISVPPGTPAGTYTVTISVVGRDANGDTQTISLRANITVSQSAPATPSGLSAAPGCSGSSPRNVITWNSSSGATGYRLYRSTSSGGTYSQIGGDLAGTSYTDSSVTAGTTYYYKVLAYNSAGSSAQSSYVSGVASNCLTSPSTPSGISVSPGCSGTSPRNSVSWNSSSGATGYRLYRSTSSGGTYSQIGGDLGGTSYTDSSVTSGNTYYYKVLAYNSAGSSAQSSYSSGTAANCAVSTYVDLTAGAVSPTSATVNVAKQFNVTISNVGTAGTGASFYNFFQRATAINGGGTVTDFPGTSMPALAAGSSGTASVSYTFTATGDYSMRACADKSSASNPGTIAESDENNCGPWTKITVGTGCPVPANLSPNGTTPNTSVSLSWDQSAPTATYHVRLNDNTDTTYNSIFSKHFDDPAYLSCGPHYYCENFIPSSICSGGRCTIPTPVPVITGHNYSFWVDAPPCLTGSGDGFTVVPAPNPDLKVSSWIYSNSDGPIVTYWQAPYTLSWGSVSNATSCTLDGSPAAVGGGSGAYTASGFLNKTHTLSCTGAGGTVSDSVTLNVPPKIPSMTGSCPASGSGSFSWTKNPGYPLDYVRFCELAGGPGSSCAIDLDAQIDDYGDSEAFPGTTFDFTGTPGKTYYSWVHSKDITSSSWGEQATYTVTCDIPSASVWIKANNQSGTVSIPYNTPATLSWSYSAAASCSITPPASIGEYPSGSGSISTGNLVADYNYTISCEPGGANNTVFIDVQDPSTYTLNLIKTGQGTVTSSPAGINCGTTCMNQSAEFVSGSTVTLTASRVSGRIFTGWTGCDSSTRNPDGSGGTCDVTVSGARTVMANFAVDPTFKEF